MKEQQTRIESWVTESNKNRLNFVDTINNNSLLFNIIS